LSYGLQWLAFGVMAPLGVGYFLYSEIRARRRAAAEASAAAQPAAATPAGPDSEASSEPDATPGPAAESRAQRRQHRRDELRAAAGTTMTHQVGDIGHGRRNGDESRDVRDKLTRRYGG
ncbi:SURF1 family protein, partial [Gordonia terrae]